MIGRRREKFQFVPKVGMEQAGAGADAQSGQQPAVLRERRAARAFYVSPEAMARRLEVLGLFPKGTYDVLRSRGLDHAAVRTIVGEPEEGVARPTFLPRYTLIAVEAYEKELISEGELARMLRIGRVEARELVDTLQDITDTVEEQQRARA